MRYPKTTLLILLILTVAFFLKMQANSRMETNLDEYMPKDHPAFVYSELAEEKYGIKDGIIIAIENPEGIYTPGTLKKIKDLSIQLGKMPEIDKADIMSLYTADNITGSEFGLDVRAFYNKVPSDSADLAAIQTDVRGNDMILGKAVSKDETVALVIARIGDDVFSEEFYHRILDLAAAFEGPEKIHVAGRPIVEGTMAQLGPQDMQRMVPIVLIVIILVLYLILRSFRNTLFTLLVVLFSVIWSFGLMALLDIPIYAVSTMIPVMLIAIGVAYGIHLYNHLELFLQKNPDAPADVAIADMVREMWKPVTITAVTTIIGFVALVTSEVYPIKYFGLFSGFGVLAAMIFSLIMIPAALQVFGLPRIRRKGKSSAEDTAAQAFAHAFAASLLRHKYMTLGVTALLVVAAAWGTSRVWINSSFLDKFEKDSDIVRTDTFINEKFGGTSTLNVILDSDSPDAFKQPQALRLMDTLQTRVRHQPKVGDAFGLVDYIKRMNQVMNADNPAFYTIPDDPELIAQYLLLYEMSGDPENLWKVTNYDFRSANVTFQLKGDDSRTIQAAVEGVKVLEDRFSELGITIHYAGSGYKALVFTDLILEGQIKSLVLSLVLVVVLLSLMFRSIKAGLVGSLPISLTTIISFGVMGGLNIPLSTTTALISSIAIGIGIDYAVHFIDRYRIYTRQTGDMTLSIQKTMHHSGRAIVFNAIVVIAGFLVLMFSVFPPNRSLGALVSLNMFTSFLGTITIMVVVLESVNLFCNRKPQTAAGNCREHEE